MSFPRLRAAAIIAGATIAVAGLTPGPVSAQSLRGSRTSVQRSYNLAVARGLHFYKTTTGVKRAATRGRFVKLTGNANYRMLPSAERLPYVKPTTRTFVHRLSAQYRAACGEQLVVTSAIRPESRQPRNASKRSVHPTGLAIDLRKPQGKCLTWLRSTFLQLEKAGLIDATEEFRPPHFHVVVFPTKYEAHVKRLTAAK